VLHPAPIAPQKAEVPTVATFATKYLEGKARDLPDSSMRTIETQFRHHILPHVGHLTLDTVTYTIIEDLKVRLANTPRARRRRRVEGEAPKPSPPGGSTSAC
jgi:hypothetical protein